ncbi:MAG TPA: RHS repeat-associated core domain-containing protein [Cyclobacteriaceae bacterium]|nr:RHS repeat-associated core domain-containing protein [Cyclobacteriaceae bacterium]
MLVINEAKNEEGNIVRTYSDFTGRTIMKEVLLSGTNCLRTYYVRNPYGEIAFIIPPKAIENLNPDQSFADTWYFQYEYDEEQRLVGKKSPGSGWVYTIYDRWERPVLTQDGNQRSKSPAEWSFIKYDEFNRAIVAGVYKTTSSRSALVTAVTSSSGRYETLNETSIGYTLNQSFPTTVIEDDLLSITYYDNYEFKDNSNWDIEGNQYDFVAELGFSGVASYQTKNLVTGGKIKILGENIWLNSVTYYDSRYRKIQAIAEHQFGSADRLTNEYDFTGQLLKSLYVHVKAGSPEVRIAERFDYDHAGRLLRAWHKVNSQPEVLMSAHEYNELGQLIKKTIHTVNNNSLQFTNYKYNIRGWLTHLNYNAPEIDEPEDYFNLELAYQNSLGTDNLPRYDGNITAARWQYTSSEQSAYNYEYTNPGYLSSANYKASNGSGWTAGLNDFNESASYDANGNITSLSRNSNIDGTAVAIDNLSYSYNGNQLLNVTDSAPIAWKDGGFKDSNTAGNDYIYDSNGNLISDLNKQISIEYNFLNLPSKITFSDGSYLKYIYDGNGDKLAQATYSNQHQQIERTDYVGLLIYINNELKQILHQDGHLSKAVNSFEYFYYMLDHLGTTRVVLQTELETSAAIATLEAVNQSSEESEFLRYDNARKVQSPLFDRTNGSSTGYAIRLNGTSNERYGIAKSISVMPGDTVSIEVYAKYIDTNSSNWTNALNTLLGQIASGTAPAGTVVDGLNYSTSSSSFQFGGLLNTSTSTGDGPKAYLNWLIFDRDFNYMDGGFVRLSDTPREYGQDVIHERLSTSLVINQSGYVYTYLSNENETLIDVYFDDFTIEHNESHVVQINDYYPYGMLSRSYLREDAQFTNYLFQGKNYESLTQWHDFHARQYDAALGRWFAPDPAGQFSSPYSGMGNNPVMMIDPDGRFAWFAPVIIGAIANITIQGLSGNLNSSWDFYKFGIIGGAAAYAGYSIGGAVSGGLGYATTFGGAVVNGALAAGAGSFASGFIGGAGNAWGNGANFNDGLGVGFKTGGYSAISGGIIGGISGGIRFVKQIGVFKRGLSELGIAEGEEVPRTDEFLRKAQKVWFKDAPMEKVRDFTVENVPEKIQYDLDVFGVEANTRPIYNSKGISNGMSDVYFNKNGFMWFSPKEVFFIMGHEFVHVSQYAVLTGSTRSLLESYRFREDIMETFAWDYHHHLAGKKGFSVPNNINSSWNKYVKLLDWRNFAWTKTASFIYPIR